MISTVPDSIRRYDPHCSRRRVSSQIYCRGTTCRCRAVLSPSPYLRTKNNNIFRLWDRKYRNLLPTWLVKQSRKAIPIPCLKFFNFSLDYKELGSDWIWVKSIKNWNRKNHRTLLFRDHVPVYFQLCYHQTYDKENYIKIGCQREVVFSLQKITKTQPFKNIQSGFIYVLHIIKKHRSKPNS